MEVALAAIALAGTTVGALIWFMKWLANNFIVALEKNTQAAERQAEASDEVLKFMKNLNGKLEGAFVAKVKEKSQEK